MRFVAIIMAALLALSLTACTDNGNNNKNPNNNQTPGTSNNGGTNGNNNGTNNNGNANNNNGLNGGSNNTNGNTSGDNDNTTGGNSTNGNGTNGNGTSGGTNGGAAGGTNGGSTSDTRRVMYNGNLYDVTDETLDSDEVGVELFSISNVVTDTPAEDGDAIGLDEGTKVYRLKDDNEYDEIAVEINNIFYKAVKKA